MLYSIQCFTNALLMAIIITQRQSQYYLVFSVLLVCCFVLEIKFLQDTCSYLEGNKLKNVFPRIHQNAPESIV